MHRRTSFDSIVLIDSDEEEEEDTHYIHVQFVHVLTAVIFIAHISTVVVRITLP